MGLVCIAKPSLLYPCSHQLPFSLDSTTFLNLSPQLVGLSYWCRQGWPAMRQVEKDVSGGDLGTQQIDSGWDWQELRQYPQISTIGMAAMQHPNNSMNPTCATATSYHAL